MIPSNIENYLQRSGIQYRELPHERAVSAQRLAHVLHVSGHQIAKAVIVEIDGRKCIAVSPGSELFDENEAAHSLGASSARLLGEDEFESLFPDCEVGAEPPFGGLYSMPVLVDESLTRNSQIVVRGGSHTDCLLLSYADFERLETPRLARLAS